MLSANDLRKLWTSGGPGLSYDRFCKQVTGGGDHDVGDLTSLLRRDQKPELDGMIRRVVEDYRFLGDLTDAEKILTADEARKNRKEAEALIASLCAVISL